MNGQATHAKRRPRKRRQIRDCQVPSSHVITEDNPFVSIALEPASLETFVGGGRSRAEVLIPPYDNMAPGDIVTVAWERRFIELPPLTEEKLGLPLVVTITDAMQAMKAMRDIRLTWQVKRVSGQWSGWAPAMYAPLRCPGSFAPTPWLELTTHDEGRSYTLPRNRPADPIVRVEGHAGAFGDRVNLYCDTIMATGKTDTWSSDSVRLSRDGQTIDFAVPLALLRPAVGGCCIFHYTISKPKKPARESIRRRIDILGNPKNFPAPVIQQLDGAVLDPQHVYGGASVDVPLWPGAGPDDECRLIWEGTSADGTITHYTDVATGREAIARECLTFPVPAQQITCLEGGSLRTCYRVTCAAQVENPGTKGLKQTDLHTIESDWLELRVQRTKSPPMSITDDLNGLTPRRIESLRRAYMTFTPTVGRWAIRGGRDAIRPYHDGTFLACADDHAVLRIEFSQACSSVRFGYGASGPGGNGSQVFVEIYGVRGGVIAESAYVVPRTGLPGLWIHLHARDYGELIAAIVVRKESSGEFRLATAQLDNFTLCW
jgi:hypothetical protein